jgi:hypothetical protein
MKKGKRKTNADLQDRNKGINRILHQHDFYWKKGEKSCTSGANLEESNHHYSLQREKINVKEYERRKRKELVERKMERRVAKRDQ